MCGLAGFIEKRPRTKDARDLTLRAMGGQLARRGPDEETRHDDGDLAFVFRRLSIIDVDAGTQPIWNEDRTVFVAVNGEIYNHESLRAGLEGKHTFRTRSDSEVVLHLFEEKGPRALDDLLGMFVVVIWDAVNKRLFVARDRFGIKPLFFCESPKGLLFGSEQKALLAHPDCPRQARWADVAPTLTPEVRPRDPFATFLHGVSALPGGHFAVYERGALSIERYWNLEAAALRPDTGGDAASFVDAYGELFVDAVKMHLMSDVPLGLFLSGGLDSAMIAAAAARHTRELPCFLALLETVFASGDAASARAVAEHTGFSLHPVLYDDTFADDIATSLASFEYFVWMMDSPRFSLEAVLKHELHRYAKTVHPGLKVMLIGQGSDEFAGGYSQVHVGERSWPDYLADVARHGFGLPGAFDLVAAAERRPELDPRVDWWAAERRIRQTTLQFYNLWHEDRTSSGQGVESRVPFLDHRLVELLVSVPARLHAELFPGKRILRRVAERLLPAAITSRPKEGYLNARRLDPIRKIQERLALRVLPGFLEKYTGQRDALFDADKIVKVAGRIPAGGRAALEATHLLLNVMAIAVFDRLVTDIGRAELPPGLEPPSPLHEATEPPWTAANEELDAPLTQADDVARLESDVRPCLVFEGTERFVLFARGRFQEPLGAPEPWAARLALRLGERLEGASVAELAAHVGAPLAEVARVLAALHRRRLLVCIKPDGRVIAAS